MKITVETKTAGEKSKATQKRKGLCWRKLQKIAKLLPFPEKRKSEPSQPNSISQVSKVSK